MQILSCGSEEQSKSNILTGLQDPEGSSSSSSSKFFSKVNNIVTNGTLPPRKHAVTKDLRPVLPEIDHVLVNP